MAAKPWRWIPVLVILAVASVWLYIRHRGGIRSPQTAENHAHETSTKNQIEPRLEMPQGAPGEQVQYILRGKVTSETNLPLPGAIVSLYRSSSGSLLLSQDRSVSPVTVAACDINGDYDIRPQSWPASPIVSVTLEGYARIEVHLTSNFDEHSAMIRNFKLLAATACVEGNVVAQGGTPVPGANVAVSISALSPAAAGSNIPSGTTAGNGRYKVMRLPTGSTFIAVSAQNYFRETAPVTLAAGPCSHIDFRLTPAATFSLILKDQQGAIISGPKISFSASNYRIEWQQSSDGLSLECKMEPGGEAVQCLVGASGYKNKAFVFDPVSPPSEIIMEPAERVSGFVVSESGIPIEEATVNLSDTATAETDQNGRFSIPVIKPPEYQLIVKKVGYAEQHLTLRRIGAVEITLLKADSGLSGTLLDSSEKPIRGFIMLLDDLSNPGSRFARTFSSEEGRFYVTDVPPGLYKVTFATALAKISGAETSVPVGQKAVIEQIAIKRGEYLRELVVIAK